MDHATIYSWDKNFSFWKTSQQLPPTYGVSNKVILLFKLTDEETCPHLGVHNTIHNWFWASPDVFGQKDCFLEPHSAGSPQFYLHLHVLLSVYLPVFVCLSVCLSVCVDSDRARFFGKLIVSLIFEKKFPKWQ